MAEPGVEPQIQSIDCIHDECGRLAFRVTERPHLGTVIDPSKIRLLDGSTPNAGTLAVCGSCGQPIDPTDVTPDGGYG